MPVTPVGPGLPQCDDELAWAVVTSAFEHDPVERWLYPEMEKYRREFPRFARALGGKAIAEGTAWSTPDRDAVAVWLPPGGSPDDDDVVDVLAATVSADKHEDMYAALTQMSDHHPSEPHWYLAWLAVSEPAQGRGLGHRLLGRCLAYVDASQLPVYLETPNPRTIPLYERHGFGVAGQTDAGSCPPITFMSRPSPSSR